MSFTAFIDRLMARSREGVLARLNDLEIHLVKLEEKQSISENRMAGLYQDIQRLHNKYCAECGKKL